ncbi:hypothetical protein BGZ97_007641, partial [Linnemannia gamsii]
FSDDGSYLSSSSSALGSGKESGRDSGHHVLRESTSALIFEHIWEGVSTPNNRMNKLTEQVELIQEQTDRNEERVEKDCRQQREPGCAHRVTSYLGDLLQENRGIKYQLSGINMGLRGGGLAAGVRHRQTTTLPKVPQEEHAAAHSKGAPLPWLFCH